MWKICHNILPLFISRQFHEAIIIVLSLAPPAHIFVLTRSRCFSDRRHDRLFHGLRGRRGILWKILPQLMLSISWCNLSFVLEFEKNPRLHEHYHYFNLELFVIIFVFMQWHPVRNQPLKSGPKWPFRCWFQWLISHGMLFRKRRYLQLMLILWLQWNTKIANKCIYVNLLLSNDDIY